MKPFKAFALLVALALFYACEETYYPPGLYASHVERLLSADDQKTWTLIELSINGNRQKIASCSDSLQWHVYQGTSSLRMYELTSCVVADTVFYGNAIATNDTNGSNDNLFTDTMKLTNGVYSYLLVPDITSLRLTILRNDGTDQYRYQWLAFQGQ